MRRLAVLGQVLGVVLILASIAVWSWPLALLVAGVSVLAVAILWEREL